MFRNFGRYSDLLFHCHWLHAFQEQLSGDLLDNKRVIVSDPRVIILTCNLVDIIVSNEHANNVWCGQLG